mmetsp:Transcript_21251/g.39883  ORF Transcript_21251/g.39883 Transcript_21251/m.39883 type:complete len:208 (-) Transcript_21251:409-1032(-)
MDPIVLPLISIPSLQEQTRGIRRKCQRPVVRIRLVKPNAANLHRSLSKIQANPRDLFIASPEFVTVRPPLRGHRLWERLAIKNYTVLRILRYVSVTLLPVNATPWPIGLRGDDLPVSLRSAKGIRVEHELRHCPWCLGYVVIPNSPELHVHRWSFLPCAAKKIGISSHLMPICVVRRIDPHHKCHGTGLASSIDRLVQLHAANVCVL